MGFDPELIFGRHRRPREVRRGGGGMSGRRIALIVVAVILVLLLASAATILRLRADYLFYASVGHTNVFWTPFVTQVVSGVIVFLIAALATAVNIPRWRFAASAIDKRGGKVAVWAGAALAVVVGLGAGIFAATQWQDIQMWLHGTSFGATDPVFGKDYSFYIFTLPIIDDVVGIAFGIVVISLIAAIALAALAWAVDNVPSDVPLPIEPPSDREATEALGAMSRVAGIWLVAFFALVAVGLHYQAYHLTTNAHTDLNFVGLDATDRNVVRPILGVMQWVALGFAVLTAVIVGGRRRIDTTVRGAMAGLVVLFVIISLIVNTVPSLVYDAAYATPNAQSAQQASINDFLTSSRYAWGLQGTDVTVRNFSNVAPPTAADLASDPGTLANVRLQDYRQLPDTLSQIDRTRNYQTYPTITVDRYATPAGPEEVMIGPREIDSTDVPAGFVSQSLIYTHGYGYTAVSVNQVTASGTPTVLAGGVPGAVKLTPGAPSDLVAGTTSSFDPRIYCGATTSAPPVVVDTKTPEFDYPSGNHDQTSSAGAVDGIPVSNFFDRLALSVSDFGGTDLLLTNQLTPQSEALVNRNVSDRVTAVAPFLSVDSDPYMVVDPDTQHLMYVVDAYVKSDRFPSSFQLSDGTSYMRNAVKAVVDAKTCAVTLYALDLTEPMTATYNAIYPGLFTPFSQMPTFLKQHMRYPEDFFKDQATVFAQVHVSSANVFYNGSDRYRVAQENLNGQNSDTQPYYVELTLPGDNDPSFVLLQTFSPGSGAGSGGTANNMTAWLAAQCDYTKSATPQLFSVPLNNSDNVLGPLQFDNNLNTNPDISRDISLLGQHGSSVILGNVIVLPFNNDSFLYVRPLYVAATSSGGSSFPQLQLVLVGTQNKVAEGSTFQEALDNLIPNAPTIPGQTPTTPTPSPSPGTTPTTTPPATSASLTAAENALLTDIFNDDAASQADFKKGDIAAYGKDQAAEQADIAKLRALLAANPVTAHATSTASPSPSATP